MEELHGEQHEVLLVVILVLEDLGDPCKNVLKANKLFQTFIISFSFLVAVTEDVLTTLRLTDKGFLSDFHR